MDVGIWGLAAKPFLNYCTCAEEEPECFSVGILICTSQGVPLSTENGRGGGHRESQGTDVAHQQVKLKVEACLDTAAPDLFSGF